MALSLCVCMTVIESRNKASLAVKSLARNGEPRNDEPITNKSNVWNKQKCWSLRSKLINDSQTLANRPLQGSNTSWSSSLSPGRG